LFAHIPVAVLIGVILCSLGKAVEMVALPAIVQAVVVVIPDGHAGEDEGDLMDGSGISSPFVAKERGPNSGAGLIEVVGAVVCPIHGPGGFIGIITLEHAPSTGGGHQRDSNIAAQRMVSLDPQTHLLAQQRVMDAERVIDGLQLDPGAGLAVGLDEVFKRDPIGVPDEHGGYGNEIGPADRN